MLYNEKYYKVINSDNLIMDVLDSDSISYVMWQEHNGMLLSCNSLRTKLLAQGILSSDQTIVWHTAELKDFPDTAPDYETVKLEPIDEETYLKLKEELEQGEQPSEPSEGDTQEEEKDTSEALSLKVVYEKVKDNISDIDAILGRYDVDEVDLPTLQYYKQEENKDTLRQFLQDNPILWQDGNYYGVTQDDQNEMIADKAAYELKHSIGDTSWKLEWHNIKHACREFTVEEFAALLNAIIDFVYPYRKLQETYKEKIYACTTKEQVVALELEYNPQALIDNSIVEG